MLNAIKALFTKKKPEPVVVPKPVAKKAPAKATPKAAAKPAAKKTTPKK